MTRWTDTFLKGSKKKKESWNKGQTTKVDGYNFPSKLHASVYCTLKLLEKNGEIKDIRCEVTLPIVGKLKFKVDFVVFDIAKNFYVAHEAKGFEFPRFKAISQAWDGAGPMDLVIWKGDASRPFIFKTIKGKS